MKKHLFVCIFLLSMPNLAFSKNTANTIKMALSLSPTQILLGSLDGKYALKLQKKVALVVPLAIQYFPGSKISQNLPTLMSFALGLGTRFFPKGDALYRGFYIEPLLTAGYSTIKDIEIGSSRFRPIDAFFLRTSLLLGYSHTWQNGFMLNLACGIAYNHAFGDEAFALSRALRGFDNKLALLSGLQGLSSRLVPAFELSLGYGW